MKRKENSATRKSQAANDATRRTWGEINLVTKIIPNKKKKAETDPKYREERKNNNESYSN